MCVTRPGSDNRILEHDLAGVVHREPAVAVDEGLEAEARIDEPGRRSRRGLALLRDEGVAGRRAPAREPGLGVEAGAPAVDDLSGVVEVSVRDEGGGRPDVQRGPARKGPCRQVQREGREDEDREAGS